MSKNVLSLVADAVRAHPRRIAIVENDRKLTYEELGRAVAHRAALLSAAGVRRGKPVSIYLGNGAEFALSFLAAAATGAVVAPINDHYRESEIAGAITKVKPTRLITSQATAARARDAVALTDRECPLYVVEDEKPASGDVPPLDALARDIDSDAALLRLMSSGTTGPPKLVTRGHAQLVWEIETLRATLGFDPNDRFLGAAPFAHVNGLVRTMLSALTVGATLVPLRGFGRHLAADCIEQNGVTIMIGVPFMFAMLARTATHTLRSLRLCVSASAPLTEANAIAFADDFGIYVSQLYGSTETGSIACNLGDDVKSSLESVGKPLPGVTIALDEPDGDGVGEVMVKSPGMFAGYDGRPAGDAKTFRDGAFLTGDLGRFDATGRLYLTGRKKLLINRGGFKVSPGEIEALIGRHPKVVDVVVVGETTTLGDDRVKAVVVGRDGLTEADVVDHCRGKIADYKIPSLVVLRDELPRGPTGKVDRSAL